MAEVSAHCDIVTPKGFTVAKKGDAGEAVANARPHDPENWGRVLVYFKRNKHGYWVHPGALCFHGLDEGKRIDDYIPQKETFDPYGSAPEMPDSRVQYDYHFGKNLQLCRRARRISQSSLGRKMGVYGLELAQSTICYRENSPASPGGKFVNAAAKALKVPAFVFFVPLDDCKVFNNAKQFLMTMSSMMCTSGR